MVLAILILVVTLSCIAIFLFDGLDRMLAFAVLFISGLWLLQSNEIPSGGRGVKLVLNNLFYLIISLLILKAVAIAMFQ